MTGKRAWPEALIVHRTERRLEVRFDSGEIFSLPAELLRVESPSAEVKGHGGQKRLVAGKHAVGIDRLEPVGNYAVRIVFDDGHDTGLYSWDYLYALGRSQERLWTEYLNALDRAGLSRQP